LSACERELARRLKGFGIAARFAPALLLVAQVCAAGCLAALSWFFAWHPAAAGNPVIVRMAMACVAGVLGWYLPVLALRWAARRRVAVVVAGLPDALELLVICAEGGLALGDGIDRIVTGLARSQPKLAEELALTAADLKLLPSQAQALARLAERIDSPIVQSVVTTLSQTIRFGTPFVQAMRRMASELRNDALIRMEERANQLPGLLTVPMIFLIIPPIFVVIGGPGALQVLDSLVR
jgi:tight adherence protein C